VQLTESQVSASALAEVFSSAFMDVYDLDADSFRVKGDRIGVYVEVDKDKKFIKYSFINKMNNINISAITQVMNKMNQEYYFLKFSLVPYDNNYFYTSHYYMSFKKGIINYQLVDNLKMFERVTYEAAMSELGDYF
jgi:hypothetical protein